MVRHSTARLGEKSETATSSMSKATEGDSAGRPSRSSDRSRTVSSSVAEVGRSRSDDGPMPSGTKGSESHRSRSGERGHRDRGHGSERCHESSRFHHLTRHRESGERAWPRSSSGGSSSRSKQADVTDVRPSTSTHHQHHHSPCPLHLKHRLVVPRLKLQRQRLPSGLPGPVTRRRPFHPQSLWWEDPGPMGAQCLPGPTDLNAIDYADRGSGSQLHDRRESVDSVMSGLSFVSRREVQLSPVAPQQTEKRTIIVILLPPRPADDGPSGNDPASDGPADDGPAYDGSAGDGSSRLVSFG